MAPFEEMACVRLLAAAAILADKRRGSHLFDAPPATLSVGNVLRAPLLKLLHKAHDLLLILLRPGQYSIHNLVRLLPFHIDIIPMCLFVRRSLAPHLSAAVRHPAGCFLARSHSTPFVGYEIVVA